jgi:hypothetical protein
LIAHLRGRATAGFDIEAGDIVGDRVQQRGAEGEGYG